MANDHVIKATIDIGAEIGRYESAIKNIQGDLNKLALPDNIATDFKKIFNNAANEIDNLRKKTANNEINLVDEKSVKGSLKRLNDFYSDLIEKMESRKVRTSLLEEDQQVLNKLNSLVDKYTGAINKSDSAVAAANKDYREQLNLVESIQRTLTKNRNAFNGAMARYAEESSKNYDEKRQEVENLGKAAAEAQKDVEDLTKKLNEYNKTKEEYKDSYSNKAGNKSGWSAAYAKYAKEQADIQEQYKQATEKSAKATEEYTQRKQELDELEKQHQQTLKGIIRERDRANEGIKRSESELQGAKEKLQEFGKTLADLKTSEFNKLKKDLDAIDWDKFGIKRENITSFETLKLAITEVEEKSAESAAEIARRLAPSLDQARNASRGMSDGIDEASASMQELKENAKQLDQLKQRVVQFFSIGNAVALFRRALHAAMDTVRDLDKVMTETAVVTNFSVGDMWKQLPEYTKRANELGVTIHSVYEASTLYYQQGLKTNEVMAVTNATLRMARIAGLEAADATDRVTNALRGFNMEINESNANNIADVYSKLAAISASNVDEISTAMTKVASLASSANMSFENTAAFLSQIIETTRESAETAGTALKTVVARFSEVKELYSKGELLGTDEEGDEIDVNKVSKALRTAGINLNEFLTGQKGLDEIFMDLAQKWDSLDIVQQRYIATMAAGSRQQSRFIALMSDYKRTQELTTAANSAAGASTEQYNKTLESLETKLAKLKNAWDEFLMSIANNDLIKGVVDFATSIVSGLNKITDAISGKNGVLKSISAIGLAFGSLKLGKNFFKLLFGNPLTGSQSFIKQVVTGIKNQTPLFQIAGKESGSKFLEGLAEMKAGGLKQTLKASFGGGSTFLTAQDLGLKSINLNDARLEWDALNVDKLKSILNQKLEDIKPKLNLDTEEAQQQFKNLEDSINSEKFKDAYVQAKELGVSIDLTGEEADQCGAKFKNTRAGVMGMTAAMTAAGGALLLISNLLAKGGAGAQAASKGIRILGTALLAIPPILKAVEMGAQSLGLTIKNIPIVGWALAGVSALVALGVAIADIIDTPAEAAAKAKEAVEQATEAANQAREAVDNLESSYEKIVESGDKIKDMTAGTRDWTKAVHEHNKEVIDLLQEYKDLDVVSEGGVLKITKTSYDAVEKQYQKRESNAQIRLINSEINSLNKDIGVLVDEIKKSITYFARDNYGVGMTLTDDQLQQIAIAVASNPNLDTAEELTKYVKENLKIDNFAIWGDTDISKLQSYGQELIDTKDQLDGFGVSLGNSILALAELDENSTKFADGFINNSERITNEVKTMEEKLNHKNLSQDENEGDFSFEQYKQFVSDTYGPEAAESITGNNLWTRVWNTVGNFKDNNGELLSYSDVQGQFADWLAEQNIKEELVDYVKGMEEFTKDNYFLGSIQTTPTEDLTSSYITSAIGQLVDLWLDTEFSDYDIYGNKATEGKSNQRALRIEQLKEDPNSWLPQMLPSIWEAMDKSIKDQFGEGSEAFEAWSQAITSSFVQAIDSYQEALNGYDFDELLFGGNTVNNPQLLRANANSNIMSLEALESFTAAMKSSLPNDSGIFLGEWSLALEDLIPDIQSNTELFSKLASAFSTLDWKHVSSLKEFKDILSDMGIDVAESDFDTFIDRISKYCYSLNDIDFSSFIEQTKSLQKIIDDIEKNGTRTFSKEEYESLIGAGADASSFVMNKAGQYTYTGQMNELINTLKTIPVQRAQQDFENARGRYLISQAASDEYAKSTYGKYEVRTARDVSEGNYLQYLAGRAILAGTDLKTLGISGLTNATAENSKDSMNRDEYRSYVEQLDNLFAENAMLFKEGYEAWNPDAFASLPAQAGGLAGIAGSYKLVGRAVFSDDVMTGVQNYKSYDSSQVDAFKALIIEGGLPEALKESFLEAMNAFSDEQSFDDIITRGGIINEATSTAETYDKASQFGVDPELLAQMAEHYSRLTDAQGESYEVGIAEASELALRNINLNEGLKDILSSYKDWSDLLAQGQQDAAVKSTSEYQQALMNLESGLKRMLGIQGDLSAEFMESAKVAELLERVAIGDTDAILELQKAAADEILLSFDLEEESFDAIVADVDLMLQEIDPSIEITTDLNEEAQQRVIDAFNELLLAGAITADQMDDYFSAIGFVPKVEYTTTEGPKSKKTEIIPYVMLDEEGKPYVEEVTWEHEVENELTVPTITDLDYAGAPAQISPSNTNLASQNRASKPPKAPSNPKTGGSGGGGSKPNLWKNPYDELYNLQEKINSKLREREKLEHRYQDMLEDHTKTYKDLTQNSAQEVASLRKQLALQNEMLSGRKGQMARVANEKFEDSEGNLRSYSSMGVTKYAWYDEATQTVQIDWKTLEGLSGSLDEDTGKAIEEYVSRLEEIRDQIQDTEDAIEDAKDQIIEVQRRGREEYLDFEQQVYDAVVNQRQQEIDTLSEINSSIKTAADKTIEALQDEIQKERQARDNEKAQEDLYDKEMRLAYLQRDTSGGNELEIQKLQEEINNDQESYQDKLIDQTIQEMQDEATRAEEQRQAQIDLLDALLKWDQEHGVIWQTVEELLTGAFKSDGSINPDSNLYKLLNEDKGVLSKIGDLNWRQELAKQIALALQGRESWWMAMAQEEGNVTVGKKTYTYKDGKWYDSKGSEYDIGYDAASGEYTAKKVQQPAPSEKPKASNPEGAIGRITSINTATNIRSAVDTSTSKNIIGVAHPGDSFEVIGRGAYDWYKIKYGNQVGYTAVHLNGMPLYNYTAYATGGLVDSTGPAWLDGSKSHPEMVLNAADTQNLITLKNVLAAILQNDTNAAKNNSGNNYFDINIQADIDSDYDVDRLADRIKKQIYDDASYRNVNAISYIR